MKESKKMVSPADRLTKDIPKSDIPPNGSREAGKPQKANLIKESISRVLSERKFNLDPERQLRVEVLSSFMWDPSVGIHIGLQYNLDEHDTRKLVAESSRDPLLKVISLEVSKRVEKLDSKGETIYARSLQDQVNYLLSDLTTAGLTPREEETARLAMQGLSNQESAEMLQVSPKTIKDHLSSARKKIEENVLNPEGIKKATSYPDERIHQAARKQLIEAVKVLGNYYTTDDIVKKYKEMDPILKELGYIFLIDAVEFQDYLKIKKRPSLQNFLVRLNGRIYVNQEGLRIYNLQEEREKLPPLSSIPSNTRVRNAQMKKQGFDPLARLVTKEEYIHFKRNRRYHEYLTWHDGGIFATDESVTRMRALRDSIDRKPPPSPEQIHVHRYCHGNELLYKRLYKAIRKGKIPASFTSDGWYAHESDIVKFLNGKNEE